VVLVPLGLIGGTLVVLQTPAAAWIVEPVLAAQTGMEVQTRSVRVSPLGTVVIAGASLDAPDVDGVAGRVLTVERVTARIDWTATLSGSPGLKDLRLAGPTLRLSQNADTGVLNAASFKMLGGGGGGGATPSVTVRNGAIELGEHSGETYTRLRRWSVVGAIDPADGAGVSAFSFAAVPAEASMGGSPSGSLGLDGTIGPDGVRATLDGLTLEDWPASIVPSRLRTIYARLDLSGRLLPSRFTVDPDGRVSVRMTLDGVDLNLPFNEAYSLEGRGELLRMRQTRGSIEFGADGLEADISGLIDELRYDVQLDYQGLTADAPFTTELATRFRMDERFRPRRFLPPKAIEKLEMFDNPAADVDAVVRVSRASEGAAIGVEGRARVSNGTATYAKFRYPFSDLEGTVSFTRDDLAIERITGRGPTGATLVADGRFEGLGEDARVLINVAVRGVPIDRHLYAALTSGRRQLVEALFNTARYEELVGDGLVRTPEGRGGTSGTPVFAFGGAADVDLTLQRHPDRPEDDRWTRDTVVRLDRAGLVPEHFPLPIVARGIELRITDDQFTLTGGRYEGLTGGEAFVRAALDQTKTRPGSDPLPIVEIEARGIPVDERLLAAIPGYRDAPRADQPVSLRSILDNLRISGAVECRAVIGPRPDGSLGYDVEANLENATARPNAALPGAPDTPPGAGAAPGETDPLVLAGMTGIVYVTERLIVVDFRGELQSPGRPLAPTPITLLTQLTLPERRGGVGDVARVGGLLPIQEGPPVPGPGLYATARADGLDLAMPLEYAAAVVSPELARRLSDLRAARDPDGVVALRTEVDGIVGGHSEITLGVDRIRSLAFDHRGVRHRVGQSRGTMELRLGVRPQARFSGFRAPVTSGGVETGEIALNGVIPLIPPGEDAWRAPRDAGAPPASVTAAVRHGRIESPASAQIVGAFAGERVADWIRVSRVAGTFELDLRLSPLAGAAPIAIDTGTEADAYAVPALSAMGTLRPGSLALDLPESRLVFDTVEGAVLFEGLGGRVDNLRASAPGLRIGADGPWTFSPGRGAGMDLAIDVAGERLDEQVRTLLPAVVLGVLDRFEVGVEGPLTTRDLRLTASALGTDDAVLTVRGSAGFTNARALVGLPISEIAGGLDFEAEVTPGGVGYAIELEADRMRAGRLRVEDARATILADGSRPGVVLIPSITGRLHGGRIAGSAQTRLGDPEGSSESRTRYWLDLHASDVRAAPVFDDLLLPPEGLVGPPLPGETGVRSAWTVSDDYTRGLLDADLSLTGLAGDPSETAGRGVVRVAGGSVIALPGLINLIEFSNLRAPLGAQLDLAEGVFYVDGTTVAFERLSASSRTVEILGHGTMDWTTQDLDLRFRSRAIRPVPIFSGLLEQIRDELITTKITGRPGDLDYSAENFGSTRRLIGALLGEPETEQERVMSAVEQASRASKNRDPGRDPPPVMPTRSPPDRQPDRQPEGRTDRRTEPSDQP
jgi:hypothetical protein